MNDACRDVRESLDPDQPPPKHAADHLATCLACRAHAAAHERMLAALRTEPAPIDDVTRARLLARMAPELDAIAGRRRAPTKRIAWRAAAAVAVVAVVAGGGWWLGRDARPAAVAAIEDREQLRPYVISGATTDPAATTLLAGRFSALEVPAGQLVRASFVHDTDQRIAAVGPARVEVAAAAGDGVNLAVTGTVLVDQRDPRRVLRVRAAGLAIRAQHATFAVQATTRATVVFVDRGEIELDGTRLRAGEWAGPTEARSPALVALLREQANAIAPPTEHNGILAIGDGSPLVTQAGAVLGNGPLWARLDVGDLVIVAAGRDEHRVAVAVRDGEIVRVAAPAADGAAARMPAPAIDDGSAPHSAAATTPARTEKRIGRTEPTTARTEPAASSRVARAEPSNATGATGAIDPEPVAPTAAAPTESAAAMYLRAETALRDGDRSGAEAIWSQLLAAYPSSPQAASALYDLASLTRARDPHRAQAYLAKLLAGTVQSALREPASYLSCRLHAETGELVTATSCFESFRTAFAGSSHDAEVLAWLTGRAQEIGGCAAARALADEYLRKYPHGSFAARAARCKAAP